MSKFLVIRDTREKDGWYFKESNYCQGMIDQKLDTGDYSVQGLEDVLCIERKGSVSEIANNIVDKGFKYKFLILEFGIKDIMSFPEGSDIPRAKWNKIRIKGNFILKRLAEIQTKYDIHVITCEDKACAWHMTNSIMKRVFEIEG